MLVLAGTLSLVKYFEVCYNGLVLEEKKMKEWIKKINWKYVIVMCLGNVILSLGVAIFKLSGLGNDPFSGMIMALSDMTGMKYARLLIIINLLIFIVEVSLGRKLIGLGTFVNMFLVGYIMTFFYDVLVAWMGEPQQMLQRILLVCVGVIITSLGVSMYQLPDQGVAPYDSVSLIMTERLPKIPYFWNRVSNDALCALICWLTGGIVGLGTLVSAFGLGPVIHFFNKNFTQKLLDKIS